MAETVETGPVGRDRLGGLSPASLPRLWDLASHGDQMREKGGLATHDMERPRSRFPVSDGDQRLSRPR